MGNVKAGVGAGGVGGGYSHSFHRITSIFLYVLFSHFWKLLS